METPDTPDEEVRKKHLRNLKREKARAEEERQPYESAMDVAGVKEKYNKPLRQINHRINTINQQIAALLEDLDS